MRTLITCLAILFLNSIVSAQTKKIDSLKRIVDAASGNDEQLAAILAYCEDYSNIALDSIEKYAYIALELAAKSKDERLKSLLHLHRIICNGDGQTVRMRL